MEGLDFIIPQIWELMLLGARFGTLLLSLPFMGASMVPTPLKGAIAMSVAFVVAAGLPPMEPPSYWLLWMLGMGSEVLLGFLMGMAVKLLLGALELAGELIGTQIGFLGGGGVNPFTEGQGDIVGGAIYAFGAALFFIMEMHHVVIRAAVESLHIVPLGTFPTGGGLDSFISEGGRMFLVAALMTAPFFAVNSVINIAFAVLGKVAPRMNVFLVSFALRILAGLATLTGATVLLAYYLSEGFMMLPQRMLEFVGR